jgi:hypothetical protein
MTNVPGESGDPASRHYDDLIADWAAGHYHPMPFTRKAVEAAAVERIVLEPPAQAAAADPFVPIRFLEGRWTGDASGKPGKGKVTREYAFELRGKILVAKNRSEYEPRAGKSEGEVHEDWGVFTYDRRLKRLKLRQFHVEGFVNEYELSGASEGRTLEFTTTAIENIPRGWRAREAYRIVSPDEVVETFSLAEPGKDFDVYSETVLRRVR